MKHFTTEEWIDFVNQMTPREKQEAMRKHLGSGCKGCGEKLRSGRKFAARRHRRAISSHRRIPSAW